MFDKVINECERLGFEEAAMFAMSLESHPPRVIGWHDEVGLRFDDEVAAGSISERLKIHHGLCVEQDKHTRLIQFTWLIANHFRPIPLLPNSVFRPQPRRSDPRNAKTQLASLKQDVALWIETVGSGDDATCLAILLNLVSRPDLRSRLRIIRLEAEAFTAVETTVDRLLKIKQSSAAAQITALEELRSRVSSWCEAVRDVQLKRGPQARHPGLVVIADTTKRAFLHFSGTKAGADAGVTANGRLRRASFMAWSYDVATQAFPSLEDLEGVQTWRGIMRYVESYPRAAEDLLTEHGVPRLRFHWLPWLDEPH